ncbi:mechanosensitive ion channel [Candidatus Sulfidibacterium hydrothermale]|uniref:mechanosensitive ion channel family protein n=1 Tax=Candidatus Sulfidibacterium hydrothermale TaxID=2875962 RepID=UPI001F0A733A|nr:mechanosensitive ion channel domain-containing protein [Candidatus Sulfidibacterium hydrothermale]UBM61072.1 mechanosensitive ion channel [Candidatus Sulfidibacterium hydrothermale]
MKKFLEYHLVEFSNFTLTPYSILMALIIVVATWLFLRFVKKIFFARMVKRVEQGTVASIYQIIKYVVWVLSIIIILQTIGFNINYLIASSAALLVGLGLGVQQIFNDVVSGLFLLFEGNVKVGDVVQLEDDIIATVKEINLRISKVETRDNVIVIVPNSKLISENVINWSTIDKKTRFKLEVGVAYGSDVKKVREILLKVADAHPAISKSPKPFVRFEDFGDSALIFHLFFWTTRSFRVKNINSDLRFAINDEFEQNKIVIPFPQQDIYVKELPKTTTPEK